jgi:hypothetical protein
MLALKYFPVLKALEAMSAIVLLSPGTWSGTRDDAWRICILSPRKRSRRPAGSDDELASFVAHDTAEVLSQNSPICLNFISFLHSNASQANTIAANSKSFI